MRHQAEMIHSLRAPEELDPAPGFYARVMQRIEERAKYSIWSAFLYSPFAKRLVYASVTVAVMLGTYVLTEESRDGHLRGNTVLAGSFSSDDAPVTGSQAQQRAAVLANFVSYSPSSIDEGPLQ